MHLSNRRRSETGRAARLATYFQSLGKRTFRAQLGASERYALGSVHSSLWSAGPAARRDFAGHRFQRRSDARPAAIQLLQRRLRPAHVPADFERHTGCLLSVRLRPGNASSHARIVPMLLRLVPRLERAFPGVRIKLRGDAGFALPLLYDFCEFFGIQYVLGIPANCVFQRRAERLRKKLKRRYRRTELVSTKNSVNRLRAK